MKYTKGDLYNFLEEEANNRIKGFFEKTKKNTTSTKYPR